MTIILNIKMKPFLIGVFLLTVYFLRNIYLGLFMTPFALGFLLSSVELESEGNEKRGCNNRKV